MSLNKKHEFNSLAEYHLRNPEYPVYEVLEQLLLLLEESRANVALAPDMRRELNNTIQELLMEPAGKKILDLICRRNNINLAYLKEKLANTSLQTPHTFLALLFLTEANFNIQMAAKILQVNVEDAVDLMHEFKKIFRIDDFVSWLQSFLANNHNHKLYLQQEANKNAVLHGKEIVTQAVDTAQERANKIKRHLKSSSNTNIEDQQ